MKLAPPRILVGVHCEVLGSLVQALLIEVLLLDELLLRDALTQKFKLLVTLTA